ncbi:MAG: GTP-binding protein [Clostridia bacterium]|nr:GTP-binding protein [Clostridia bacterium]
MTKIDIFSGFLGAGKTTLIKKLIKEAYNGEKIVLIENEFGEIGIDGGFMEDAGIEVTEMNSGCICCSLVGDFGKALTKVLEEYNPDRILIEPSGVGKLSDVIRAVKDAECKGASLNSYCAVADAKKCKMYMKNFGEFFNDQIESASCIVLSHTDDLNEEKIEECIKLLRTKNDKAQIVASPWDSLCGKAILEAIENTHTLEDEINSLKEEHLEHHHHEHCKCHEHEHHHNHECHCHEHHHDHDCGCHDHNHEHEHHHHADEVFTSWGVETAKSFTEAELKNILSAFEDSEKFGTVLRAKGIIKGETDWLYFDYIPSEIDIRHGSSAPIGRICVIGAQLNKNILNETFGV